MCPAPPRWGPAGAPAAAPVPPGGLSGSVVELGSAASRPGKLALPREPPPVVWGIFAPKRWGARVPRVPPSSGTPPVGWRGWGPRAGHLLPLLPKPTQAGRPRCSMGGQAERLGAPLGSVLSPEHGLQSTKVSSHGCSCLFATTLNTAQQQLKKC